MREIKFRAWFISSISGQVCSMQEDRTLLEFLQSCEDIKKDHGYKYVLMQFTELKDKMTMESGYYTGSNFDKGGGFAGAVSQNADKSRLILVHKTQNLKDRPELKKTLNIKGKDVKLEEALTLEDYLVFQKKYFAKQLLLKVDKFL